MAQRLFVGNLPYRFTSSDLSALFAAHGAVKSAEVVMDRATSQSRGFGFVEMESTEATQRAMAALNGIQIDGRTVRVNEARSREPGGK
ncbi:MAG: RNA-binding protein [Planctomycetes bacterium]|nr:RNA-binding protein [Planctomycetota bacterium]